MRGGVQKGKVGVTVQFGIMHSLSDAHGRGPVERLRTPILFVRWSFGHILIGKILGQSRIPVQSYIIK
jgi:hypothetical protein